MKYIFFRDNTNRVWAFPPLEGQWGGKALVAGLRHPKGGYRLTIADDGSGVGPGGELLHEPGYFTRLTGLERSKSKFKEAVDPHHLQEFRGEVYHFVDPDGLVHAIEGYWGSMQGVELVATYYGLGSAYFVGADGRVFCDGAQMYGPGYFTPLDPIPASQPHAPTPTATTKPPEPTGTLRDTVLDLLVEENPKKLDTPSREAYEDYVVPLLKECFDNRTNSSLSEAVWRAGKDFGVVYDPPVMERLGAMMGGVVHAVDHHQPPEWSQEFQTLTDRVLEVDRNAGSGNLLDGGYVVFRRPDGTHYLEHTHGPSRGDDVEPMPWDVYEVPVVDIPDDVYKEFAWVKERDKARLRAGRDRNVLVRAEEVAQIGDHHGWENLDSYPLRLTGKELRLRWENEDWDEEVADDGYGYRSRLEAPGLSDLTAVLYELLTQADRAKEDFDEALALARRLRRATDNADATEQDVSYVAHAVADALTQAQPSVFFYAPTLLVRIPLHQVERIVYDSETKTWKVKKYY